MGTHPIFESDFDCLTDFGEISGFEKQRNENFISQLSNFFTRKNGE